MRVRKSPELPGERMDRITRRNGQIQNYNKRFWHTSIIKTSRQEIIKEIEDMNCTIGQLDLNDILKIEYKLFHMHPV